MAIELECEDLWDRERLKDFLAHRGLRPRKDLSQNFLCDREALSRIARTLGEGRIVLEIGPGLGALSCLLVENFDLLVAVEVDERFKKYFQSALEGKRARFVRGDFLQLDPRRLIEGGESDRLKLAGNIPYEITAPLIDRTMENADLYERAVLTVQKEVADRLSARPGGSDWGPLSFLAQGYAEVEQVAVIPPGAFFPRPGVHSAIVKFDFFPCPRFEAGRKVYFSLVRETFTHRRKTIRNALRYAPNLSISREEADRMLAEADLDRDLRPEKLGIEDFDRLARALVSLRGSKS